MSEEKYKSTIEDKRSLINSLQKLQRTADQLENLISISELLVDKFKRTEGELKRETSNPKPGPPKDIIELFDDVNDRLQVVLDRTADNIHLVINMID